MFLVRFHKMHLSGLDWIERERTYQVGIRQALSVYAGNPSWTLLDSGYEPVACGGVVIPYAGLGEAWLIAGPTAPSHARAVVRACRHGLAAVIEKHNLVRVQAMVLRHLEQGHRLMRVLGFEREALLRKYGFHGADMFMYAKFPGEIHA